MATIRSRGILETYFEMGDVPTNIEFWNLIASYVHMKDDQVTIFTAGALPVPDAQDPYYLAQKRFGVGTTIPSARLGIEAEYVSTTQGFANNPLISFHKATPLISQKGAASVGSGGGGLVQGEPKAPSWYFNLDPDSRTGFNVYQAGKTTSALFITEAGAGDESKVAIGTNSVPVQKLHIEGSKSAGPVGIQIKNTAVSSSQGWVLGQTQYTDSPTTAQNGAFIFSENTSGVTLAERMRIAAGGNVGINNLEPEVYLHIAPTNPEKPTDRISILDNSGLFEVGAASQYLLMDGYALQAGATVTMGGSLVRDPRILRLQPLGGDVIIHEDSNDPLKFTKRAIITQNGLMGLGIQTNPVERLELNGAIKIGDTTNNNAGTIRFRGDDLQGYVRDASGVWGWASLTMGSGGGGGGGGNLWAAGAQKNIFYYIEDASLASNVGIGLKEPGEKLHVRGGIKLESATANLPGSIQYAKSPSTGDQPVFQFNQGGAWFPVKFPIDAGASMWLAGPEKKIYYPNNLDEAISTNVGIGINNPMEKLHLDGAIIVGKASTTLPGTIQYRAGEDGALNFFFKVEGEWKPLGSGGGGTSVWQAGAAGKNIYYNDPTNPANVGIGTASPTEKLHVVGGGITVGQALGTSPGTIQYTGSGASGKFQFRDGVGNWLDLPKEVWLLNTTGGVSSAAYGNSTSTSRVGIGVNNAAEKLQVLGGIMLGPALAANAGTIQYTADGKFQFRDGAGWQDLTFGSSVWSTGSSIIYSPVGATKVGIGIATPTEKLHVNGGIRLSTAVANSAGSIQFKDGTFQFNYDGSSTWQSLNLPITPPPSQWTTVAEGISYGTPGSQRRVGITTDDNIEATLHVHSVEHDTGNIGALIHNESMSGAGDSSRIGMEIRNSGDWTAPDQYDIGLYVSEVSGYEPETPECNRNIAALVNGNIVVGSIEGDPDGGDFPLIGEGGRNVLSIQKGKAPTKPASGVQLYAADYSDVDDTQINALHILTQGNSEAGAIGTGDTLRLFKGRKLTTEVNELSGEWSDSMSTVENLIQRVRELEDRLKAFGLLADH